MLRKSRLLASAVFLSITLGFVGWARSVTSWRPQQIGAWPPLLFDDVLLEDEENGPWLQYEKNKLQNIESGYKLTLPASYKDSPLRFSPDGRSFAFVSATPGKPGIEWRDVDSGKLLKSLVVTPLGNQGHQLRVDDFAFCANEKSLRVALDKGIETLPLDGSPPRIFPIPELQGVQMLSEDGNWLVASIPKGTNGCTVKFYDLQKQRVDHQLSTGIKDLDNCQLSPDGALLSISEARSEKGNGESWMLDSRNGNRLWKGGFDLFSPDGHSVLNFNSSSTGQLQDAETGAVTRDLKFPAVARSAQFASDSNWLYVLSDTGTLWKMRVR